MAIVYDMASGKIQSEQEQAHGSTEHEATASEMALQLVQEIECEIAQEKASIHIIRTLLDRE